MSYDTELTRLLDIRCPIVSAPMGAVAGGRLAAAVTRAGGLGLLGPGYHDAGWIAREFAAAEGERVGIGFITWDLARSPARLDAALAHRPSAVMLSFGDAGRFVDPIRRAGAVLILQVQTLAAAREAASLGADLIVAQGSEAGGHGASRALFPLLPAVVDAVAPVPVLAAGGIADGRGLVAALALGAAGALIGTRFYAAEEALGGEAAKRRLVERGGDDTVRTTIFDIVRELPWPEPYTGRAVVNDFSDRWHGHEADLRRALPGETTRYRAAAAEGDLETAVVWGGEGLDLVRDVAPAGEILHRIMREAETARERLTAR
jgi:nitronate monooxygenase